MDYVFCLVFSFYLLGCWFFFLFSLNLILVFAFSKNYFIKVLHVYLKMKINFEASANQMLLQYLSLKEDTKVSPFIDLSYGECPDHKALYMYVQLRVHVQARIQEFMLVGGASDR